MTEDEQRFTFAVAALMGLISRGATPAEVRDTLWQYAEFAMIGKPNESNSSSN
jgi:hypothetical protein